MGRAASDPGPARARLGVLTTHWQLWLARLLEEASWSLLLVGLLFSAWHGQSDPRLAAAVAAGWFLLRPVMPFLVGRFRPFQLYLALVALLAAVALSWQFIGLDATWALIAVATALGGIRSIGVAVRAGALAQLVEQAALARASTLDTLVGRAGTAGGAVLAMLALLAFGGAAWPWVYGLLLAGAYGVLLLARRPGAAARRAGPAADAEQGLGADRAASAGLKPLNLGRRASYLAGAFAAGALGGALIAHLPALIDAAGADVALVGAALAVLAVGGLVRLPLRRVRLRVPRLLVAMGLVGALAGVVALTGLVTLAGPAGWLPLLLVVGGLSATADREQLIALRRAGAGARRLRGLLVAVGVGQLLGSLVVVTLGSEPAGLGGPLVIVGAASVALTVGALVVDRRSLFAMRHQVQQFSWDASPPPRSHEPAPATTRQGRLEAWIGRRAELETVEVTLPISGRQYAIARPSGEGRERLFDEAKADPERQMPYWAKVWPSGVALADVAVERGEEVRGQQVLELGAGLGVTACAVLEEGGRLLTADYSLLPLAFCRLNGLANAGRAPGSLCFNWRDEAQVRDVLRRHPPIGLILAADVLYEYRDIGPLIDVIERLLAPTGSLWLAEPVRVTAQRFLDMISTLGWSMKSRRIRADWPDATSGWVNVHIIRREIEPSEAALGLGGLQL
ncbi:hypothetical protein BH23CHL7_BH23CHL7_14520 [soil metagenome]